MNLIQEMEQGFFLLYGKNIKDIGKIHNIRYLQVHLRNGSLLLPSLLANFVNFVFGSYNLPAIRNWKLLQIKLCEMIVKILQDNNNFVFIFNNFVP